MRAVCRTWALVCFCLTLAVLGCSGSSGSPSTTSTMPPAAAPVFSVPAGTYSAAQTDTLSTTTPGAQIFYTTNGSTPTTTSTLYAGPLSITASETLKAIAVASGYSASPVATAAYAIALPVTPTVTATLSASTFALTSPATLTVKVSCDSACGQVSLTIDGSAWQTGTLDATGSFTTRTYPSLTAGAHTLQAAFLGSAGFNAADSGQVGFTISSGSTAGSPHIQLSTYFVQFSISGLTRDILLTNTGGSPLQISRISTYTPYFTESDSCAGPIAPNAGCTISVTDLTPAKTYVLLAGSVTTNGEDQLVITSNDPNGTTGVALQDNKTTEQSLISNIAFGPTVVGDTATESFLVMGAPYPTYCSTTLTGSDFSLANTANIPPTTGVVSGAPSFCLFTVTFKPTAAGARSGRIDFGGDGSYIPLSGLAVSSTSSTVTLSPATTTLRDLTGPQPITLSNFGSAALNIQSITVPAGFSQTNTCGASLPPQSVCSITVSSTLPAVAQQVQGLLAVTDDAGTQTAQLIGIIDTVQNFGTWAVHASSPTFLYPFANGYSGEFGTDPADFSVGDPKLAEGILGTTVAFTPTATGPRSAYLTLVDQGALMTSFLLLGTGLSPAGSGPLVTFGPMPPLLVPVGQSATAPLSINNSGTTALSVTGAALTGSNPGDFSTSACTPAQPSTQCNATLNFLPGASGGRSATLTVTDSASGATFTTPLSAIATPAAPAVTLPASIAAQQNSSTSVSITVVPQAGDPVAAYLPASPSDFTFTKSTCAQGESPCMLQLTFAPVSGGTSTVPLTVVDGSTGSPETLTLAGSIAPATITLSPTQLTFAARAVNTISVPQTLTLGVSNGSQTIQAPSISGPNASEFQMSTTCTGPSTLTNTSCTIGVTFAPVTAGAKSATLTVPYGYTGQSLTATLTGTAQ